jgi:hypothetical protein
LNRARHLACSCACRSLPSAAAAVPGENLISRLPTFERSRSGTAMRNHRFDDLGWVDGQPRCLIGTTFVTPVSLTA